MMWLANAGQNWLIKEKFIHMLNKLNLKGYQNIDKLMQSEIVLVALEEAMKKDIKKLHKSKIWYDEKRGLYQTLLPVYRDR